MKRLRNIHPGEIIQEEFLAPFNIPIPRLAKDTGIQLARISDIISGKKRVTADIALRLAAYFGNSPKFWLGLQDDYDIEEGTILKQSKIESIKRFTADAA